MKPALGSVDFILNLAAILLWFSWRSLRTEARGPFAAATLAGTLKKTALSSWRAWKFLAGLLALLAARGLLHHCLGSPAGWVWRLDLGPVVLAFRADFVPSALVYSLLSFGRILAVAYFWLTAVVTVTRGVADPDPIQKLLRLQAGRTLRWPWPLAACLPFLGVAVTWLALQPVLVALDVVTRASVAHLLVQTLLLNAALCCTLKFVLPPLLLLHFIASYVYLGGNPIWEFVSNAAQQLVAPLKGLPLRIAKLDFTPLVEVALILCLLHWVPWFIQSKLAQHNLTLWPQ